MPSCNPSKRSVASFGASRDGVGRIIYGQTEVIDQTLISLLSGGHLLLVGLPGLAKTKLVETLGIVLGLDARRVQFTPDLMPADILGSEVLEEDDSAAARSDSSPVRSSPSC